MFELLIPSHRMNFSDNKTSSLPNLIRKYLQCICCYFFTYYNNYSTSMLL